METINEILDDVGLSSLEHLKKDFFSYQLNCYCPTINPVPQHTFQAFDSKIKLVVEFHSDQLFTPTTKGNQRQ
jgi:hypothetical protein